MWMCDWATSREGKKPQPGSEHPQSLRDVWGRTRTAWLWLWKRIVCEIAFSFTAVITHVTILDGVRELATLGFWFFSSRKRTEGRWRQSGEEKSPTKRRIRIQMTTWKQRSADAKRAREKSRQSGRKSYSELPLPPLTISHIAKRISANAIGRLKIISAAATWSA